MICGDSTCACAVTSDSLTITGSGAQGDPWHLETNAFGIVTSGTHPGSPFTGQFIWETDTGFVRVWDGVSWKLVSWTKNPVCQVRTAVAFSVAHNNGAISPTFDTEDTDVFGWHVANTSKITPNIAGWYELTINGYFEAGTDYTRQMWGPFVNGTFTAPARRFDFTGPTGAQTNIAATTAGGLISLNGTTDYVEVQTYHSNGAAAARDWTGLLKVEWKAPP